MKRLLIRTVFLFTVVGFIAQFGVIARFGKPYPNLLMPGFEGSGGSVDGRVTVMVPSFVFRGPDGFSSRATMAEALSAFPTSHRLSVAQTFFWPLDDEGQILDEYVRPIERRYRVLPGLKIGSRSARVRSNRAELGAWLVAQGRRITGHPGILAVDVVWEETTYGPSDSGGENPERTLVGNNRFEIAVQ